MFVHSAAEQGCSCGNSTGEVMKRKLKIAGLSLALVTVGSAVIHSAVSGGIGFGIAVILCFFLSVFALAGIFFICFKQYQLLKKHTEAMQSFFVRSESPKKKRKAKAEPIEETEEE